MTDANCLGQLSPQYQTYMMADAHREAIPKSSRVSRLKPRLCIGIKTVQNCQSAGTAWMAERGKFVSLIFSQRAHLRNQFSI